MRVLMSTQEIYSPGLEGVIAGETAISTVEGGLRYRGYPVTELAEQTTFVEVTFFLPDGDLPTARELAFFHKRFAGAPRVPDPLLSLFKALPLSPPTMDAPPTAVGLLAQFAPKTADNGREA